MKLSEILSGLEYTLSGVGEDTEISMPVTDSREAAKGSLFICIDGSRRCGADFAADAVKNGAAACAVQKNRAEKLSGLPTVTVEDARLCAAAAWNNYFGRPGESMRLYGITGTNGKTSTAAFLEAILRCGGRKTGSIGTLGCFAGGEKIERRGAEVSDIPASMTTPDPKYLYEELRLMKDAGVTDAVMEVSSHALLQKKTAPLRFEWGIFTNLSPEHLDCHKTMENYFRAKASLFDNCRHSLLNSDDPWAARLSGIRAGTYLTDKVKCSSDGVSYTLNYAGMSLHISTCVAGSFTVYNTMLAAVCALEAGIAPCAVEEGIASVRAVRGRMEKIADRSVYGFDVLIDYAHTPGAMEASLSGLRGCGRLTAVFGCGGDRDREKRPEMGRIAHRLCDRVIVTSDNPRTEDRLAIIEDIKKGIPDGGCVVIPDRADAICYALETAAAGETVILMGKGHEDWETDAAGKKPFSERDICRRVLKRKYGK